MSKLVLLGFTLAFTTYHQLRSMVVVKQQHQDNQRHNQYHYHLTW